MKFFKTMLAVGALVLMSGCALLPDSPVTSDAKKAVEAALITYTRIYQPAVIEYGKLPLCPVQVGLCHDGKVFADLADANRKVNAAAQAARKVLDQDYSDPGALQNVMSAIQTAQLEIARSGVMTNR